MARSVTTLLAEHFLGKRAGAINISRLTARSFANAGETSPFGSVIIPQTTDNLAQITATIERGGVIAFRTDTFYGLGVDPFNVSGVRRIRELKGREEDKPILIVISNKKEIERLVRQRSQPFDDLTGRFWPGALTIIGRAAGGLSDELTAGTKTVGVRLPNDDKVRALIEACGGALTATSANLSGQPPARSAAQVENYFGQQIDLIIDGGATTSESPSTVVDAISDQIKLVREGVIPWSEIRSALHP